ncbi:hypothetical protein HN695_05105 [Candidatus Woesearchaeota archaeon]|jgi:hypothetical protein|nr:hypothetical protein [Candidatus Woesearchaeota archaeon]MBT5272509.1 hypothetical protein [Candidatus Woesearchaeota archaeon]MBT6041483.1 hypothetical protein [Candidatus Woesearchaeota archaeon]MBT6336371.1 hypothetical protein [Candidatus Woesearchaeota archaeon]MBT7927692.1 hypothetical protein [Candidatus Woesearchaeota archaeon]
MAKKENMYSMYLLAIVAIVAVVGVVLMVNNGGTTSVSEGELVVSEGGDLAGEARGVVSKRALPANQVKTCKDRDGNDVYHEGYALSYLDGDSVAIFSDFCDFFEDDSGKLYEVQREGICKRDGSATYINKPCKEGYSCVSGECRELVPVGHNLGDSDCVDRLIELGYSDFDTFDTYQNLAQQIDYCVEVYMGVPITKSITFISEGLLGKTKFSYIQTVNEEYFPGSSGLGTASFASMCPNEKVQNSNEWLSSPLPKTLGAVKRCIDETPTGFNLYDENY